MKILIAILFIIILILCYVVYNLYNKMVTLEKQVVEDADIHERVATFYNFLLKLYTEVYADLVRIDKIGAFRSDDDVGYIFNTIKETINHIVHQLNTIVNVDDSPINTDGKNE